MLAFMRRDSPFASSRNVLRSRISDKTRSLCPFQIQLRGSRVPQQVEHRRCQVASIQRLTSPLTGRVAYRVQIRLKGHPAQSETFRNRRDAARWASSIESAILEGRHFPHTRSKRVSFASLAQRYRENILADAPRSRKVKTECHIAWWVEHLGSLNLAGITPDCIAEARDALALQPFSRGKMRKDRDGREIGPPTYRRSGATVNRYLATLSHILATAAMQWRLIDKNPVRDVSQEEGGSRQDPLPA